MSLLASGREATASGLLEGCSVAQPSLTTLASYSMLLGIDKASRALVEWVSSGVPFLFRALADHREVPQSTAHYCLQGQR